nr:crotonase/enoyl-CoA hydratase family protein [Hyphomonas sp. Mor2]
MSVKILEDGPVWTIVHDRPDARNAVSPEAADALTEAFTKFEESDALAGVFYGSGGTFCAGWDLKYAASLKDEDFQRDVVDAMAFPIGGGDPPRALMGPSRMELNKPMIAAIEGPAVAGGMELALLCDMRVMAESAYMGVYCRRWGVPLIDGGTIRLPRLVGQGKALDLVLTGRKVEAEECYKIGLCERVVEDGTALEAAQAIAHEIARFPQSTMLADRRTVIEGRHLSVRDGLKLEWANGLETLRKDGISGAGRFSDGAGRHGDFSKI